jgi:phage tail tape-measure protein
VKLVPVLLVGGGIAYVASQHRTAVPRPMPPTYGTGSTPGATKTQLLGNKSQYFGGGFAGNPTATGIRNSPGSTSPVITGGGGNWTSNNDAQLNQKLALGEAAVKNQFNNISDVEKQRAADTLNDQLDLDPPLNGHESWEDISAAVGSATGAAVGAWIGGPYGAKVGALLGAYLGVQLYDWLNESLDDMGQKVKDYFSDLLNNKVPDRPTRPQAVAAKTKLAELTANPFGSAQTDAFKYALQQYINNWNRDHPNDKL